MFANAETTTTQKPAVPRLDSGVHVAARDLR
jgi:hypothetical protein